MSIIYILKGLMPENEVVKFQDLPEKGDVVLLSENDYSFSSNELEPDINEVTSTLNVYIRKKAGVGVFQSIRPLLKKFYEDLLESVGVLNDTLTLSHVGTPELFYLGLDEDNNYLFSMNVELNYYEKEV